MSRARWRGVWAYFQTEFGAACKTIYLAFWNLFLFSTQLHTCLRFATGTLRYGLTAFWETDRKSMFRDMSDRDACSCSNCCKQVWSLFKWHLLHRCRRLDYRQNTVVGCKCKMFISWKCVKRGAELRSCMSAACLTPV